MNIGDIIKKRRNELSLTLETVGRAVGVSKSTVKKWEAGQISNMRRDRISKLAEVLQISPVMLIDSDFSIYNDCYVDSFPGIMPITKRRLPLLGEISCGKPTFVEEECETFVTADENINADFCLRTKGDSMVGARILDGDIVFVRRQEIVDNGEIAVVIIEYEATLKRFYSYPERNMVILRAENPKYQDLIYSDDQLNDVHVLGKAVAFQSAIL